jgi:hypothetical protein
LLRAVVRRVLGGDLAARRYFAALQRECEAVVVDVEQIIRQVDTAVVTRAPRPVNSNLHERPPDAERTLPKFLINL